jgi:hypothetical protein
MLAFTNNSWHDGLEERGSGATSAVWTQKPGYVVNDATLFYDCNCRETCCIVDAKHGNLSCAYGSYGLLCSQCIDEHFKEASTGNCKKCADWAVIETLLAVVLSFPAMLVVFFVWWKTAGAIPVCHGLKLWVAKGACCPLFIRNHNFGRPINLLVRSFKQNLKTKVKLLVGFYQISTLLHSAYNVPYPYSYLRVMAKVQFLSVDFTEALPGPCIFGQDYNFARKLYAVGALAVLIGVGSCLVVRFSSGERQRPWANKALPWLSAVLFFTYPGFSAFFFDALKCRKIDDAEYLVADLSVRCSGANYDLLRAIAIVCVAFWCFGLPVIWVSVLWPERKELSDKRQLKRDKGLPLSGFQGHLEDFHAPYEPEFWWFEGVEYLKKLLLIGVVPAASQGKVWGALLALLVTVTHLAFVLAMSPFTQVSDQIVAVSSSALLFIVLLLSVILKMNSAYESGLAAAGINPDAAANLLIASNVAVIVFTVAGYFISVWQARLLAGKFADLERPLLELREVLQEQGVLQPEPQWEWQDVADAQEASTEGAEDQAILHELAGSLRWPDSGLAQDDASDMGLPAGTTALQIVRSLVAEKLQRIRQQFPSAVHADLCEAMVMYSPHNWLCHKGHSPVQSGGSAKYGKYQGELEFGSHQDFHHGAVAVLGPIIGETSVLAAMVRELLEQGGEGDRYNLWYLLFCVAVEQPEYKDSGVARIGQVLDEGHSGMRLAHFTRKVNNALTDSGSNNSVSDAGVLALRLYSVSTYIPMNAALRKKGMELMKGNMQGKGTALRFKACIQSARQCLISMQAIPREHVDTYRSVNGYLGGEFERNNIGLDYAFISATTQKAEALKFSKDAALTVLFVVTYVGSCPGADISLLSVYPGQKEVLFPPCTGFSLAADDKRGPIAGKGAGHAIVSVIPAAAR